MILLQVAGVFVTTVLVFMFGYEMGRLQGETRVYYEWFEANIRHLRSRG